MTAKEDRPVELLRILDEKFLVDDAIFRIAQPTGTLFMEPAGLRLPDGTLDVTRIERLALGAGHRLLAARQRLRAMPLALTAPAWVPVDRLDPATHVRVLRDRFDVSEVDVLAGERNLRLDPERPLWNVLVADRGDVVVLTLRMSHALGDGLFGMRVLDALTGTEPAEPLGSALPPIAAPRTGAGVLLLAGRAWWTEFRPLGSAWHEYWRKPFSRRLRRWAGRIRRTVSGVPRLDTTPPGLGARLHHGHALLELKAVRIAAKQAGTTVHNHVIAVALQALLELRGTEEVLLDVPISRRAGKGGDQRNHIVMTQVRGTRAMAAEGTRTAVDEIVELAKDPAPLPPLRGRSVGYVSFLPWQMRPRIFGTSTVVAATLWPVLAAEHEIAVFGSAYSGVFSLAVSGVSADEVDAVLALVRARLGARTASA